MPTNKFRLTKTEEKMLREKLKKTLLTIIGIIVGLFLLLGFFAPKLGVFFGFFSKHRNEQDTANVIKPSTPIFATHSPFSKENKLTLNGYAQTGFTIVLYVNGPEVARTTVGSDGLFTFLDIALIDGTNTIFAKAVDQQGVESDASSSFSVTVDKDKPKITIESPKNGDIIRNLDRRVEIKGKISEKAAIKINGRLAIQRPDLSFEFLLGVEEGEIEITVEATDAAGNIATEKLTVKYVRS